MDLTQSLTHTDAHKNATKIAVKLDYLQVYFKKEGNSAKHLKHTAMSQVLLPFIFFFFCFHIIQQSIKKT